MGNQKVRSRDSETTRRAALDAAQRLFAEKGFAGASMREIASVSGISQPLIHYHFGSKEGLYSAVKERLMLEGMRSITALSEDSPDANVDPSALIRTTYNSISSNEDLMRLIAWAQLERETTSWPGEEEIHRSLAGHMQRHLSDISSGKDVDSLIATIMIEALVLYWSQNSHYYAFLFEEPLEVVTDRYLNRITRLFFVKTRARTVKE
ncbi:MAG: TetR/AcrR family transcriptional regulator [Desulfobacteraceae bacterium]|nr:TetR/AcrR family transcriptional regulator [Desulfobacteraceae bacterium]